jgi:hypothetical protein
MNAGRRHHAGPAASVAAVDHVRERGSGHHHPPSSHQLVPAIRPPRFLPALELDLAPLHEGGHALLGVVTGHGHLLGGRLLREGGDAVGFE